MQEQVDKHIEKLADKMLRESTLESPSFDFTNSIMAQVEALESKKVTTYKPLIPAYLWFVGGFLLVAITSYLFMNNSVEETTWIGTLDFSKLSNNSVTQSLSGFRLPKTLTYSIGFLAFMICVQVTFLKRHFDKRLES